MKIEDVMDPLALLVSLGGLHDSWVDNLAFDAQRKLLVLSASDMNANFRDLPDYRGRRPCDFHFVGVSELVVDVTTYEGIAISEFRILPEGKRLRAEIDLRLGAGKTLAVASVVVVFESLRLGRT